MKVAIFSVFALLVAVNAGVIPQKKFAVTTEQISQLLSDYFTLYFNNLKKQEPLNSPGFGTYNIKSGDIDLSMEMVDVNTYLGDIASKSISASLMDNLVGGQVGVSFQGFKMVAKLDTKGTVKGKTYNLVGDVVIPWPNVGEMISFGASYDDKSVTVESVDMEVYFTTPTIQISGLSFEGVSQEELTSLFSAEFAKQMEEVRKQAKEQSKYVIRALNEMFAGKNLQEVYDEYRKEVPVQKN